ncbi:MAG: hypothetical protein KDC53_07135 [Saprospiraceae bacterium]|nr:hypothetical protein [Saprospiraceae bacterium]
MKEIVIRDNLPIEVINHNMLHYATKGKYGLAICLGNSFSYFAYDDMLTLMNVFNQAIVEGGYLLINTAMLAESVFPSQESRSWMQAGTLYFLMVHEYDNLLGALKTDMQFILNDRVEKKTAYHFIYRLAELMRMFSNQGFKVEATYGDLDQKEYDFGDAQAYILLRKL